jgi:hypothetical protein
MAEQPSTNPPVGHIARPLIPVVPGTLVAEPAGHDARTPAGGTIAAGTTPPDLRSGFAALGLLLGCVGAAVQVLPHGHGRLALLLAFLMLGPGVAAMSVARVAERLAAWALAVVGSLTVATGAAVLTLWTHVWNPDVTVAALAGAVTIISARRLTMLWRTGGSMVSPIALTGRTGPPLEPRWRARVSALLPLIAVPAAVGLWAYALARISPGDVGNYGLSAALGVPFAVAVALLGVGLATELFGRARPAVLGLGLLAVPAIMQATVPLLDGTLEYAWTYKHIGVVDLIRDNGHLVNSNDIYQQWPGFFAVVAVLSHVAGVDALSFAAWSSLTFALVNMLVVAALLRQFTADRRVVAVGVLLSQIAMWVDIGYFSPQAFVYPLMLGFWLIVVRWLLVTPATADGGAGEGAGRIARLRAWPVRGMPARPGRTRRERIWACVAAVALFAAITVSHQLTPFVMLLPVLVLTVLGVLRPRLLTVALGAVVVAFAAPRMGTVASQYHLFNFDLVANAAGNADTWRTPEQEFSAVVARTLAIGVWLAALAAVWLRRKRPGRVLVPAALGFLPILTLAGGNYGGEAIYRVFAFSLPFAALLIAGIWVGRKARGRIVVAASGPVFALVMLAGLQGLQGQLVVHQVRAADIVAAEYLYTHAEPNSSVVVAAPNFPTKLTGDYNRFNTRLTAVDISLVGDPIFTGDLDAQRVPEVETYVRALGTRTNYLVVSDAMAAYTDYFGMLPAGSMASLAAGLRASPGWTVFYQVPGITVFRLTPAY